MKGAAIHAKTVSNLIYTSTPCTKARTILSLISIAILSALISTNSYASCDNLLDFDARKLRSKDTINLCEAYQGKVILAVNTASECGYTPQFKSLEQLYQRYKDQGLVVLGFPSNDFNQEHGQESQTAEVCYVNYGVTFPMFAPSSVKGKTANALFQQLAAETGTTPSWNFFKYLIDKEGKAISAFASPELPLGGRLEQMVTKALATDAM
jgi:glutathione peroxidase